MFLSVRRNRAEESTEAPLGQRIARSCDVSTGGGEKEAQTGTYKSSAAATLGAVALVVAPVPGPAVVARGVAHVAVALLRVLHPVSAHELLPSERRRIGRRGGRGGGGRGGAVPLLLTLPASGGCESGE